MTITSLGGGNEKTSKERLLQTIYGRVLSVSEDGAYSILTDEKENQSQAKLKLDSFSKPPVVGDRFTIRVYSDSNGTRAQVDLINSPLVTVEELRKQRDELRRRAWGRRLGALPRACEAQPDTSVLLCQPRR